MSAHAFEYINPRYILGISDEPQQLLQPITGYVHEPLLPLEEACEPLLDIVTDLQRHIWIAKQNSKNPADGLTQDESASIRLYTMEWDAVTGEPHASLYAQLNRTLKEVDRMKLRPWFRYLKLFLTALAKLPCAPRQTVWRGVRKDHSADYRPGEELTWWAFSSCTTSLKVLESDLYLGKVGTRTLFSIDAINARTIRAHSHFTTEDEILLLPGTFLEVKSQLNPAADLNIIHLQQKVPPHVLLEPPFPDAELLPHPEPDRTVRRSTHFDDFKPIKSRPWYKKKKILFGIGILLAVIILAVILGAVLGSRKNTQNTIAPLLTTTSVPMTSSGSTPAPVLSPDAFYSFDGNLLNLYSGRNGIVEGGPISYVQGYVAYGKALVLNQSTPTQINIRPAFNITSNSSFTIEGFFMLQKPQLNSTLLQLTPTIMMNLTNSILTASLGYNVIISGHSMISPEQWHHLSFVYNASQQTATLYIDGIVEVTNSHIIRTFQLLSNTPLYNTNSSIIAGAGYQGCIDQLSITLKAKSSKIILWDATAAGYYPLDTDWLQDYGPNGINATAANVIPISGWLNNALNFNKTNAYYQVNGFTALGTPYHAFSISLWVRTETQAGVFLTISNPATCLLVLGIENKQNKLIAFLPNATLTGTNVNLIGPVMPPNAWVYVAFTWSKENGAKLYTTIWLQSSNSDATSLNNVRGGNNSLPMTVTFGKYNGVANCEGIEGVNTTKQFMGSLDELYVFTRELQLDDLKEIQRYNV